MTGPSPYVDIYISRKQAELVLSTLYKAAAHKAPSNPLWTAIKSIEKAMERNA